MQVHLAQMVAQVEHHLSAGSFLQLAVVAVQQVLLVVQVLVQEEILI